VTALERAWERRLAADGLASLDYPDRVGNRGSGKPAGSGTVTPEDVAAQAARRDEQADVIARRADVLREYRFPTARDRRIWTLHAEGIGTKVIARQLHHRRRIVMASIAATTAAAKQRSTRRVNARKAIRIAPPEFLAALWRALT
jgi:DNA-binding NarL/FixJ family response regulator